MKNADTYQKRRSLLGSTYSRTLFVIPSGAEAKRSHSVKYRFKTTSDFSYLCGFHLSDALLVIAGDKTYLLYEKHNEVVWGENTTLSDEDLNGSANIVFDSLERFEEIVRDHIQQFDRIAISLERDKKLELSLLSIISFDRRLRGRFSSPLSICDSRSLVGTIRLIKDASETANMRQAAARSSRVHNRLMEQSFVGKTERQISNWLEGHFLLEDMQWTAYETIVGSGERSTLLHARASDRTVNAGELILVDAGGEWQGYCADITRVVPSGKTFSARQREIYQSVLAAQKLALKSVKPGTSLQEIHELAIACLIEELLKLNLPEELVRAQIANLMPHSTSHWIGMDVHDPSPYVDDNGKQILLAAGMCFTVEPGLYFRSQELFREYHGIGVRIEDDVLVTFDGCEVLTSAAKEIEEIEQLRALA